MIYTTIKRKSDTKVNHIFKRATGSEMVRATCRAVHFGD
ncbi:hypothetical protein ALC56_14675 [Trachymyrmex septentrionalis]|uniref:Uncharacterized protein n=1 Tax=Trachymyrmex septentrionalis TaxID=34720 RepID=A0A195ERL2_9HYME|nr:hypothetical protein ALC56_14675 [Trachymyrmex septentrionalis]